jgi:hypothetical protein
MQKKRHFIIHLYSLYVLFYTSKYLYLTIILLIINELTFITNV